MGSMVKEGKYQDGLIRKAIELFPKMGNRWKEVCKYINERKEDFGISEDLTQSGLRGAVSRYKKIHPDIEADEKVADEILAAISKGPLTIEQISEIVDRGKLSVKLAINLLKSKGYQFIDSKNGIKLNKVIYEENTELVLKSKFQHGEYKFAIASDLHLGSKYQQLSHLRDFCNFVYNEGIRDFYCPGDVVAGHKVYSGQEFEIFNIGYEDQSNYAIDELPEMDNARWIIITGNHDLSFFKQVGADVGEKIARARSDVTYLGQIAGSIIIPVGDKKIKIQMLHGAGGNSYAISYKAQKIIESMEGGTKPHVQIFGHWHTAFYMPKRNIHTVNAGCFESQNLYLRRKAISPEVGGWKVTLNIDQNGSVVRFQPEFIKFFEHKEKDW